MPNVVYCECLFFEVHTNLHNKFIIKLNWLDPLIYYHYSKRATPRVRSARKEEYCGPCWRRD